MRTADKVNIDNQDFKKSLLENLATKGIFYKNANSLDTLTFSLFYSHIYKALGRLLTILASVLHDSSSQESQWKDIHTW